MRKDSKQKLAFVCCAALALSACGGDDSQESTGTPCGDTTCTAEQVCVEDVCRDKDDPCLECTEDQICEEGKCVDPEPDPCDACDPATQKCVEGVCKDYCGGAICTDAQKCVDDICKDLCGDEVCGDDKICDKESKQCVDKPEDYDPCAECTEDEECINDVCTPKDPCANKTCPDNFRCDRDKGGECVEIDPCESVVCGAEQTCIKARCVDNSCIESDGSEKDCGKGNVCSKGECVQSGCAGMVCEEGWQCVTSACDANNVCTGVCVESICIDYYCEEGRSCRGGACVDNECLDMTCNEDMICSKGNCTYEACLGKEACSIGKMCNAEGNCVFIADPAIALNDPEDKVTDESGKTVSLALTLNNAPTQDVRVSCEVVTESVNPEVVVECGEIVFNSDNWQSEQTIVIKGVEDYLLDGDQIYKVKVTTSSEDLDFHELVTESVDLTNMDMTKAGFVFSETALTTYEDQALEPATFTVVLSSIPASDVNITLSSSNTDEGTVSPESLVFTKENWNVPQTVTVKGVDDNDMDGNEPYTVYFAPTESEDPNYHEYQPDPIKVTNVDNDVAGVTLNIPAEDYVIQEGHSSVVLVRFNTKPKNDVTVTVTTDDASEVDLGEGKVVLTPEDWNTGKEIHIVGAVDEEIDGDQNIKLTFAFESEDKDYVLEPMVYDAVVKDMDKAEIVALFGDSPIVKEGDSTPITMSMTLASKPKADVNVAVSVTDPSELKASKKEMKFTARSWNHPQDLLINSIDDLSVDGDVKSKVVMTMTSTDKNFNGNTQEFEFMTVDDDKAGFVIESNSASFPEASKSSVGISVRLLSQPTADVRVAVTSSDASELMISSGASLVFTAANWDKTQNVTVQVVDDTTADGAQTAYAKFTASSSDKNFDGITAQSALYTIIDDDAPSVVLTVPQATVGISSPTTTANVALGVQPSGNVTVRLSTSNANVLEFNPSTVTITPSDWNIPKPVTVTTKFNAVTQASSTEWIQATASGDAVYSNILSNKVNMTLLKVPEVQNFAYTGGSRSVTLPKGQYKLEVWGAQGGGSEDGNSSSGLGGRGGYSVGTIELTAASTTLYIYVGGKGGNATTGLAAGGWNGGGSGYASSSGEPGNGGGGASDIRVGSTSLYYRVIVAGGGGGGGEDSGDPYGHGGGAQSIMGGYSGYESYAATQVAPGTNATFGTGATTNMADGGGGGGGWYGGGTYSYTSTGSDSQGGGGGSGFVYDAYSSSAVASVQSNTGTAYALDPKYKLKNAQTIAGSLSMPAPGGGTETGHKGNGYARITLVY